jgi:hypothetical protein
VNVNTTFDVVDDVLLMSTATLHSSSSVAPLFDPLVHDIPRSA